MACSSHTVHIGVQIHAHNGGEEEQRAKALLEELKQKLRDLCHDPRYNDDHIFTIVF